MVKVLSTLMNRRNKSLIFCGKDGFMTPRDLLHWANRGGSMKVDLEREGCMLLVKRLCDEDEKKVVRCIIRDVLKVKSPDLDWDWTDVYTNNVSRDSSEAGRMLLEILRGCFVIDSHYKCRVISSSHYTHELHEQIYAYTTEPECQ